MEKQRIIDWLVANGKDLNEISHYDKYDNKPSPKEEIIIKNNYLLPISELCKLIPRLQQCDIEFYIHNQYRKRLLAQPLMQYHTNKKDFVLYKSKHTIYNVQALEATVMKIAHKLELKKIKKDKLINNFILLFSTFKLRYNNDQNQLKNCQQRIKQVKYERLAKQKASKQDNESKTNFLF